MRHQRTYICWAVDLIVIVITLCLQYALKGYPRKFLELLTGTPPHLTLNEVSYHSAESTEEIAYIQWIFSYSLDLPGLDPFSFLHRMILVSGFNLFKIFD